MSSLSTFKTKFISFFFVLFCISLSFISIIFFTLFFKLFILISSSFLSLYFSIISLSISCILFSKLIKSLSPFISFIDFKTLILSLFFISFISSINTSTISFRSIWSLIKLIVYSFSQEFSYSFRHKFIFLL